MAEKDDINVDLEDDEVVTVDLDEEGSAAAPAAEKAAKEPKEKKAVERVRLQDPPASAQPDAGQQEVVVSEATKALEEAKKREAAAAATAAAERQRREAAERALQQRSKELDAAQAAAESAQLTLLERGIEAAATEVESFKGQLTAAYEEGDFKKVADVQAKLSRATATLDRLEAAKQELATAPKRPAEAEATPAPVVAQTPFEQYLSQMDPASQNWLRAHPECAPAALGGNAQLNAKMMAGHYAALAQNIEPSTPEYFRVIEEHTGYRQPESAAAQTTPAGTDPAAASAAKSTTPRVSHAAPPSREVPSARTGQVRTPRQVTLSKEQQEMAKISFPHLEPRQAFAQYARNLMELEAEGKMGRTSH